MTHDLSILRNLSDALTLTTGSRTAGQHLLEWAVGNETLFWPRVKDQFFSLAFDPGTQSLEEIGRLHPSVAADPGRIYPGIEKRLSDFFVLLQKTPINADADALEAISDFQLLPPRMLASGEHYSSRLIPAHHVGLIAYVMGEHMVDLAITSVGSDTLINRYMISDVFNTLLSAPQLDLIVTHGLVQVASLWDPPEIIQQEGFTPMLEITTWDADRDQIRFVASFREGSLPSWTVSPFCFGRQHGRLENAELQDLNILLTRGEGYAPLLDTFCPLIPHGPDLEEEDPNLEHRIY